MCVKVIASQCKGGMFFETRCRDVHGNGNRKCDNGNGNGSFLISAGILMDSSISILGTPASSAASERVFSVDR